MTLKTVKIKPRSVFIVFFVAVLLLSILFVIISKNKISTNSLNNTVSDPIDYLNYLGWKVKTLENETGTVFIPFVFDDTFESYNRLQLKSGFDLRDHKGKTAVRYVFKITNYPGHENDESIRAHILVTEGKIIGGDICSVRLDGFMHGLKKRPNGKTQT